MAGAAAAVTGGARAGFASAGGARAAAAVLRVATVGLADCRAADEEVLTALAELEVAKDVAKGLMAQAALGVALE